MDRHHKDGDTGNNSPENIELLCRRCHMEADGRLSALAKQPGLSAILKAQTHCKRGHPLDDANTYVSPSGWRDCRACHRERERARKQRLREARV